MIENKTIQDWQQNIDVKNPKHILSYIDWLVEKYRYGKLPKSISTFSRNLYLEALPSWCQMDGSSLTLTSKHGTDISIGFTRIVIGDYGAFLEFDRAQAIRENIRCEPGQEYRFQDEAFKSKVKYYWYTADDKSGIKIYFQQREVSYADYKPLMLYVSPYEVVGEIASYKG